MYGNIPSISIQKRKPVCRPIISPRMGSAGVILYMIGRLLKRTDTIGGLGDLSAPLSSTI